MGHCDFKPWFFETSSKGSMNFPMGFRLRDALGTAADPPLLIAVVLSPKGVLDHPKLYLRSIPLCVMSQVQVSTLHLGTRSSGSYGLWGFIVLDTLNESTH